MIEELAKECLEYSRMSEIKEDNPDLYEKIKAGDLLDIMSRAIDAARFCKVNTFTPRNLELNAILYSSDKNHETVIAFLKEKGFLVLKHQTHLEVLKDGITNLLIPDGHFVIDWGDRLSTLDIDLFTRLFSDEV
jgi:hypothetical protein